MGKRLQQFIASVEGEEEDRLILALRKRTATWPKTRSEETAAGFMPIVPSRPYTTGEADRLARHAVTSAACLAAKVAWDAAIAATATAKAEANYLPRLVDGSQPLPRELEARIAACEAAEQDAREQYDVAAVAEVKARPHQPARRLQGFAFPLIGKIMSARPQ